MKKEIKNKVYSVDLTVETNKDLDMYQIKDLIERLIKRSFVNSEVVVRGDEKWN